MFDSPVRVPALRATKYCSKSTSWGFHRRLALVKKEGSLGHTNGYLVALDDAVDVLDELERGDETHEPEHDEEGVADDRHVPEVEGRLFMTKSERELREGREGTGKEEQTE